MNRLKQEQLIKRLETEYGQFRQEILTLPKEKIFDRACEISVKSDIKGYIESEELPPADVERLLLCENALDKLYMACMENDDSNSEDMPGLFSTFLSQTL